MGLALVPALVALLWPKTRTQIPQLAPVILLPLMGIVSVALTFDLTLDDSLAFVHAQAFWERDPSPLGPLGGVYEALAAVPDSLDGLTSLPRRVGPPGEPHSLPETLALQQAQSRSGTSSTSSRSPPRPRSPSSRTAASASRSLSTRSRASRSQRPRPEARSRSTAWSGFVMVDFPLLMAGAALTPGPASAPDWRACDARRPDAAAGVAFARKLWIA